jgi:acetyl-CoA C-acetyltransferase
MGNVLSAGQGQGPARQASLRSGLGINIPCTTINKVCSSGLKSIVFGAQSIALGDANCVITGGF